LVTFLLLPQLHYTVFKTHQT